MDLLGKIVEASRLRSCSTEAQVIQDETLTLNQVKYTELYCRCNTSQNMFRFKGFCFKENGKQSSSSQS